MKKLLLLFFAFMCAVPALVSGSSEDKPVQHIKVADVTSAEEARKIFMETTTEIKKRKKLDPSELQQIHIITYSLEKSVAYFVENLKGERQTLAQEIAVVVEDIHLASENNRKEETEKVLTRYFNLADRFISGF